MSCNTERYKYVVDQIANGFKFLESELTRYVGEWAFVAMLAAMLPVVLLFLWSQYILIPWLLKRYYDDKLAAAREWHRKKGLAFAGFKYSTALISLAAGVIFFAAVRAAYAVPDHYLGYAFLSVVALFFLIPVAGLLVSGNVPDNEKDIMKYSKLFFSPTVTALGLALGTIFLDFIFNMTPIVLNINGVR